MPHAVAAKLHDPVCGVRLEVGNSNYSTTYRGIAFHFCSTQCLERFTDTPEFYTGPQHTPVTEPIPQSRRLQLETENYAAIAAAKANIQGLKGVSNVHADEGWLFVDYDLRLASLALIEAEAAKAGVHFQGGLHGLCRELWKFMEHNELAIAGHAGADASSNRPPLGL